MSAFADASFSSDNYSSARPVYPQKLFDNILEYHGRHSKSRATAIDIACGPGEATALLTSHFDKVIGTDSSVVMIETARKVYPGIDFQTSTAETFVADLGIPDHSVDLITIAEAIHWFDLPAFYKEAHRALKPNATLAFWGYCDAAIEGFPKATELVLEYCYGSEYLGPYWQQPGRRTLRDRVPTPPTAEFFENVERYENVICPENRPAVGGNSDKFLLTKETTVGAMQDYVRSWSAYHTWKKAHLERVDIVVECFEKLKKQYGWTDQTTITLTWDTFLVLAKSV